jgi:hypothetical protein
MSNYNVLYDSWKNYTTNKSPLEEIDRLEARKILNWVAKSMPNSYSFDNLFGNKMRLLIPLKFEQKNIYHGNSSKSFERLLDLIDQHSAWEYDSESLSRGNVYRISAPEDFGAETNLKKYKSERPPAAKRVEQKIGKLLKKMNRSKNKPAGLSVSTLKNLTRMWEKEGDKVFCPQGSIVISRHPIDVVRMSDFKSLQNCHTPGSSFYKCAVGEAMGQAPVAYFISKKQLDKLFTEKGIEDIDDLGEQEILQDDDRGIKGVSPTARVRLRKFTGENNHGEEFELAIPELTSYGNRITHFKETVNDWALNSQLEYISHDVVDQSLLRNKSWREEYIRAFFTHKLATQENDAQESISATDTMNDIRDRLEGFFPTQSDLGGPSLIYHGGRYIDGDPHELFLNFFGIKEFKGDFSGQGVEKHPINVYSRDFIGSILEEFGDVFFVENGSESDKAFELDKIINSGFRRQREDSQIYADPAVSFEEENLLGAQITTVDFLKGLARGNGEYADLCEMDAEDVVEGMLEYVSMISRLRNMGSQFSKFRFELSDIEDMIDEDDSDFNIEDIIDQCKSNNWRFRIRISGVAGGSLIEKDQFRELTKKDSEYSKELVAIIEEIAGKSDILEKAQGGVSSVHYGGFTDLSRELKDGIRWDLSRKNQKPPYSFFEFASELLIHFYFKTGTEVEFSKNKQGEVSYAIPNMFDRDGDEVQAEAERIIETLLELEKRWSDVESRIRKKLVDLGIVDPQAHQKIISSKSEIMADQAQLFIGEIDRLRGKISNLYNSLTLDIREDFDGLFDKDSGEWINHPNVDIEKIENLMSGLHNSLVSTSLSADYEVFMGSDPLEDQRVAKLLDNRTNKDNLCALVTQNIRKFLENKAGPTVPFNQDKWWNVNPKDVIIKSVKMNAGQYKFSFHFPINIVNIPDPLVALSVGGLMSTLFAYLEADESTEEIKNILKETLHTKDWAAVTERLKKNRSPNQILESKRKKIFRIKLIKS